MPTFDQILRCEICNDLLYQPMTLICQHTFCYHCLSIGKSTNSMKECPLCRLKLELPPNPNQTSNNLLSQIEHIIYGSTRFQEIKDKVAQEELQRELEPEIRKEIQEAFKNTLISHNDYKKINIDLNNNNITNAGGQTDDDLENLDNQIESQGGELSDWKIGDITNTLETMVFVFYAYNYFSRIIPFFGQNKVKLVVYIGFIAIGCYLFWKWYQLKYGKKKPSTVQTYSFSYVMPLNNINNPQDLDSGINNFSQILANSIQNLVTQSI